MNCATTPKTTVAQGSANHRQKVAPLPPPLTGAGGGGSAPQPSQGVVAQIGGWRHIEGIAAGVCPLSGAGFRQDRMVSFLHTESSPETGVGVILSTRPQSKDRLVSRLLSLTHISDVARLRTRATREGINQTTDFFLCMADRQVYANAPFSRMYHPHPGASFFSRSQSKDRLDSQPDSYCNNHRRQ